ncbi:hypothetical protein PHYBLDRAFT_169597 [Phycomyces blakesleeanus NRRL 1555(-)]|uniref:Uncharacterized protein n=1 Tax=Phycomyces blakesleeanus (strain ATCC 8743b / DSM 1359 / FGSC 10004 / NBRC 33097 / NRRL 1555) TaxID=763407 RepID=A0A162N9V3_PHYB8|nr:hypothetical protein PHYBLDRAFT_169597 [Phycomyces blakesleeanus NRRL 1555(-)]OAD72468.1 hypothetical protein PHYBLDRAFT_169597 [Phycomyces blakesleeanus NRRL 1555(-)]|eukprot:XP_018290508.1 hypothetical protein PHYBLDRAFT_169597 [Phycomyces blakesleeanus NRRL 1555(-)]
MNYSGPVWNHKKLHDPNVLYLLKELPTMGIIFSFHNGILPVHYSSASDFACACASDLVSIADYQCSQMSVDMCARVLVSYSDSANFALSCPALPCFALFCPTLPYFGLLYSALSCYGLLSL